MQKKLVNELFMSFKINEEIWHRLGCFLYRVGFHTEYAIVCFCRLLIKINGKLARLLITVSLLLIACAKKIIFAILGDFIRPISIFCKAVITATKAFLENKAEHGIKYAVSHMTLYAIMGTKKHSISVAALLVYLLPLASIFAFVYVVRTTLTFDYYLAVHLDDKTLGYVQNDGVFEAARILINGRLYSAHRSEELALYPTFKISVADEKPLSVDALTDKIIQASSDDIQHATGLLIDGDLHAVILDKNALNKALSQLLLPYQNLENPNLTVSFEKKVELLEGLYLTATVTSVDKLINEITGQLEGEKIYTVQKGDSPSSIAQKHGIPLKDLNALNPSIDPSVNKNYKLMIGDNLIVSNAVDFLQVKTTERVTYTSAIPHGVEKTNNDSLIWGNQKVVVAGKDGIEEFVVDIVRIDGTITQENLINRTVLTDAITEKIEIGTKNVYGGNAGAASTGSFIWPSPGYRGVSRGFGRSGHRGLDITGAVNTQILAVDNAVVEFAGTGAGSYWSYGNYVRLRHSNGTITIYAHCNSLTVSSGQYVGKGQVIALMGSTGRSSGNHLHFEVHINGRPVDPYSFVKRP